MTRVLLVDDEPSILEVLTAYFEKENWDVDSSMNGKEALAMIETHRYDIILLDLMLPDMTGEEICQRTRETSDVPIIMLTAKSQEEDLIHGIVIGADDYIKKPFSPKEVVIRSKALLRRIGMMTQSQTDAVRSFIEDEGQGIKEEDLAHLFERFYRGDKSRDRKTGGIGIGLSIVKALVDAHGGDVSIESEREKGTKVTIFLPKA